MCSETKRKGDPACLALPLNVIQVPDQGEYAWPRGDARGRLCFPVSACSSAAAMTAEIHLISVC